MWERRSRPAADAGNLAMMKQPMSRNSAPQVSCCELKKKLQALDFAINDTVLYLDAYPDCSQALDYYHKLVEERCRVLDTYEKSCGPVTMYGNVSHTSWDWIGAPWPWEPEAN